MKDKTVAQVFYFITVGCILYLSYRKRRGERLEWKRRTLYKKISQNSDMGRCLGVDIGGTLAKVVYFEQTKSESCIQRTRRRSDSLVFATQALNDFLLNQLSYGATGKRDDILEIDSDLLGGRLHFIRFETSRMPDAISIMALHDLSNTVRAVPCTGGGAYKYSTMLKEKVAITVQKHDEFECLVKGLNFILDLYPEDVYTFEDIDFQTLQAKQVSRSSRMYGQDNTIDTETEREAQAQTDTDTDMYPYMITSVGSGVSIIKVTGPSSFERVSGSSLGGGTYWGLCRLLTECNEFDEALDIAEAGQINRCDMTVGDIYGGDYSRFNLVASTIASSFGKVMTKSDAPPSDANIARSLLMMLTQNIGQITYLNAKLYACKSIFFTGNFFRHNTISCRTLAYAIDFWSKGSMKAHFCKHEGYLGALGAFLFNIKQAKGKESEERECM